MRKVITLITLIAFALAVTGCSDRKVIDGVDYDTYGLFNQDDKKNPEIEYNLVWGNLIWGIILIETIIAPVYFFGFDLFEPVGKKPQVKGQVTH